MNPFRQFEYPAITAERFAAMRAAPGAKRIYFGDIHANALKSFENGKANFKLPFVQGIDEFLPIRLFESKFGGYWRNITDEEDYSRLAAWIDDHRELVFIKSLATSAVAACSHFIGDSMSEVGALEKLQSTTGMSMQGAGSLTYCTGSSGSCTSDGGSTVSSQSPPPSQENSIYLLFWPRDYLNALASAT